MGFYRDVEGPEEIVALVKGDPPELYVEITSDIRNRMEIVVGNKIRCVIKKIIDRQQDMVTEVNREVLWEIIGYWHELYIPPQDAEKFGLKKNQYAELVLKSVIRADGEFAI